MTIESICNQALDVIGYARHIGNIYEGSKAARVALDLYGQTLWSVKPSVIPIDPAPINWLESTDTRLGGTKRSILTTFAPAIGVFTQKIIDPAAWPPEFATGLIMELAKKMRAPLGMKVEQDDTRRRSEQRS
jgi:hypothetical protein